MSHPKRVVDAPASMLVDFDCERRCQVEVDLEGVNVRSTLNQVTEAAAKAHREAHTVEPMRHFRHGDALVRADMTAVTA